ncbi:MAG: winged helix-turn-helix domain-containing protein [Candidatus Aenigmarchaeota archaeon]|nr:winged helix-turn-helix domain-containing protein [Candidatus Aenigmarchaeota archaeon]
MRRKKIAKKQRGYDLMVLKLLKQISRTPEARLSGREIARTLNINAMAVSRSVKRLEGLLDVKKGSSFESFRLQVYLIRLKPGSENMSMEELIKKSYLSGRLNHEVFGK